MPQGGIADLLNFKAALNFAAPGTGTGNSASGSGPSGAESLKLANLDDELSNDIGAMAYPAEARLKLHNMYPEDYKDRVGAYEKVLGIQKP